ncbi:MAG: DUF1553 domain-containing protein [Mariniblastus sp.]|nr:DUF1553 domain-containing protein [Mariniblastus sp.]
MTCTFFSSSFWWQLPVTAIRVTARFVLCLLWLCLPIGADADQRVDFNRDVRPILSDNCFLCHGPAESTRASEMRLDDRQAALDAEAFLPGNPEQSHLIARILSEDPAEVMPPSESNKRLTPEQKEILRRWIQQGAEYQPHWAFVPPKKSVPVKGNPVDHFVGEKLKREGLQPSKPADLNTLLRRVTFDLNGRAPDWTEVQAFRDDVKSRGIESAYETVVDRLLAAPAYGERMTLAWLDAARYGDSSVMHADGPRYMWPWRDWVINAYNKNMPFDQFTIEQLAGDLIPDATMDQKIASGFNRNHATSDEGGAFPEELRVEYVVDRVQTTSTVWMALTMECSQCHDHKYDPISQDDYYRFFAYFNNTTDPGMQTRNGNQAPVIRVISPQQEAALATANGRVGELTKEIADYRKSCAPQYEAWQQAAVTEAAGQEKPAELPGIAHWFPLDEREGKALKNTVTGVSAELEAGKLETVDRVGNVALQLNGGTHFRCDEAAPDLKHDQPFTLAAWIKSDGKSGGAVFSRMDVAQAYRGFDMWVQGRGIGTHIIHQWPGNAIKVISKDQLVPNQWQHVVISYDGGQKASGVKIYIDGKLSENNVEADGLKATIESKAPFKIGSRSPGANWKGGVDDIRIYNRGLSAAEVPLAKSDPIAAILALDQDNRNETQQKVLLEFYLNHHDETHQKLSAELAVTNKQITDLNANPVTSMMMQDNPQKKMRTTFVLDRGQYDAPLKDRPVSVGVPAALPPLPDDAPPNRLGLAQWLTRPDHPLTARVAVNRYWTLLFGNGLVQTVGDFGAQGRPPSHPELLDWLAVEFVESGWNVKQLLKRVVMSQTYRQTSRREPALLTRDPENIFLSRSPRFRLQGELIRDHALTVGGLLVDQVGGPGVKPYQPPNIWNEVSLNGGLRYPQDKGDNLYRKSMYTYWKRSAPMPNMIIFDAPSREKCVVQRARTNTPLQALVTLNDPQFVEAARALAQRLLTAESDDRKRVDLAYQLCASRLASAREQDVVLKLLEDQRNRFAKSPEAAKQLLTVGEFPRDESLDAMEHAAWTVICQMILNLDETLTRG